MKAKLIVEGKEFPIEILDPELQKLIKPKQTGYERCREYWRDVSGVGGSSMSLDFGHYLEQLLYDSANYYSDKDVCNNNIRADRLMRQLRRFAVEHREKELDWNDPQTPKYNIRFSYYTKELVVYKEFYGRDFGDIFFDTEKTAQLAIDTFRDELIWYFTEYKDSL